MGLYQILFHNNKEIGYKIDNNYLITLIIEQITYNNTYMIHFLIQLKIMKLNNGKINNINIINIMESINRFIIIN